jgi:hypothetical protein
MALDQQGSRRTMRGRQPAEARLNGLAIAQHGAGALASLAARQLDKAVDRAARDAERHDRDRPREHRWRRQAVERPRLRR